MYRTVAQIDSATSILANWFPQVFTRVPLPENSVAGPSGLRLRMRAAAAPRDAACSSSAARTRAS